MQGERNPRDLLPLTTATFHILLALAGGDQHGYAIKRDVAASTEGQVQLGPGTLYTAIKRLHQEGLVEESDERPDPCLDDERRRYYRLTEFGLRVAQAESQRLARVVSIAHEKKLLGGSAPALQAGDSR